MKRPKSPPNINEILEEIHHSNRFVAVVNAVLCPTRPGKYLHWDKLRFYDPPGDLSHREWWLAMKLGRQGQAENLPLTSVTGKVFNYALPDPAPEQLHNIDMQLGGSIGMRRPITNPDTRNQYLVSSLIEEAITSSQLEGAATSRLVAKEMIRTGRAPRDRSERMILNNFRTMQRIRKLQHDRLSKELVFDIHRLVTSETLDKASAAGRLRLADEEVVVDDMYGQVFHIPPSANQLPERMAMMCEFANAQGKGEFVHPVIRSIILHFWLAYDHPFVDGNGRTARALFYWSMLHHEFWLCEFISISEIILKAPAKYGRAFLYTETDDNDLTYFVLYHLDVLRRAIKQLYAYVDRKEKQLQDVQRELHGVRILNHRQRALISHALRHPYHQYTIESHRSSHDVVHQTARIDLLDLAERGLLTKEKIGREWRFTAVPNLEQQLGELP